jgi:NADPH2:quinone reductase
MSQQSVIPQNMRAIAIEGGVRPPRALKLASTKTPTPKSGEVLIRVAAAGVNYPDIIQREGPFPLPPATPETLGPGDFGGPSQASVPTSVLDSIH